MSYLTKTGILSVLLLVSLLVIVSCGSSSSNSISVFDATTHSHPDGWLPAGHMTAAQTDITTCEECHGQDLSGGISQVSCTTCHLGGPLDVHPASFNGYDWSLSGHGQYILTNGTASCSTDYCHGYDLKGVANSGPSCSSCHSYP